MPRRVQALAIQADAISWDCGVSRPMSQWRVGVRWCASAVRSTGGTLGASAAPTRDVVARRTSCVEMIRRPPGARWLFASLNTSQR